MRLVDSGGSQALSREAFGSNALKDMHTLYGGAVSRDLDFMDGGPLRSLYAADGSVIAFAKGWRPSETTVGIKELQLPESAARWTALQAYRAKGGIELEYLHTEVAGVRGYQEWRNRRNKTAHENHEREEAAFKDAIEELIHADISEEEFDRQLDAAYDARDAQYNRGLAKAAVHDFFATTSAGSGNSPMDRYFAGVVANITDITNAVMDMETALNHHDNTGLELAARSYATAARAKAGGLGELPEELPHTHTEFYAKGPGLPAAARVMATNYGDLYFHSEDPDTAVAGALGVASLSELDLLWNEAMTQRTPLAAGQFVLQSLTR